MHLSCLLPTGRPFNNRRLHCLRSAGLLVVWIWAANASACIDPPPTTELEKIYCQVKAKGKGDELPEYQAFRRNTAQTQALLLKRPARKLGIELPDSASNKPSALANTPVIQSQEPEIPATVSTKTKSVTPQETYASVAALPERKKPEAQKPSTGNYLLDNCTLDEEVIICGTRHYELQTNVVNKHLESGALGADNKLILPARQGSDFADASDHDYLSQTYVTYIEKMITIGLADATMSFTKYVATWEDASANGSDFAQRFTQMYELLKQERQSNAVRSRYNNNFPDSIKQCMGLGSNLIVCDNVMQNWIYRSR